MARVETYHVGNIIQPGNPQTVLGRNPSNSENNRTVKRDPSYTNPFLKNLEPHNEMNTTGSMQLSGPNASEHGPITLLARSLTLKFHNIADILEFSFCFAHVFAGFSSKTAEDVAALFFTADLDEPARRFRHEPYHGAED